MEIDGFKVHYTVTLERVMTLLNDRHTTLSDPGVCLACGAEVMSGVEPDAHNYECESCGEKAVIGIEDLALEML